MVLALHLMMARPGVADHTKRRFRGVVEGAVAEGAVGAVLRAVEEVVAAVVGELRPKCRS